MSAKNAIRLLGFFTHIYFLDVLASLELDMRLTGSTIFS